MAFKTFVFRLLSLYTITLAGSSLSLAQSSQWFHLDAKTDSVWGISTDRTYRELLNNRKPTPVIVAVIDGGIDSTHEDLKRILWTNPKEIPGNGIDDDKNGYVDDVHGWNFIGGKDGRNVQYETAEVTRQYVRLRPLYEGKKRSELKPAQQKEYDLFVKYRKDVEKKRAEYQEQYQSYSSFSNQLVTIISGLKNALGVSKLDTATLRNPATDNDFVKKAAAALYEMTAAQGFAQAEDIQDELTRGLEDLKAKAEYAYNPDFESRSIVGDNPDDLTQTNYGNPDITGPDPLHGTHVAGIIAADRTNNVGVLGVADQVKIMAIRAVPDGDERDKDVANAIRYAVNNGAQIINMSFGKDVSPQRKAVDDAMRYALSKGVLLVHAAGNDNKLLDTTASFPADRFMDGSAIPNLITVGAVTAKNDEHLVASFSNYGRKTVDVFAPGMSIYSTTPKNGYDNLSGTSMAAPVVTGIAAVLKSYFPKLTYADLKRIIEKSAVVQNRKVLRPESDELVDFTELSKTGAIVNLYEAVKLAQAEEAASAEKKG
ncbi:subtilase family protein [Larkinella arboricola]|uniref:Subtilase family protein n=1 Tax=Larkinella arboricola TaxID=643671 RepID=A0A327X5X0_LARAB|nr:S8 family peptidase [Larkinella arboricola]RAK02325.1 subtilase family protein [Larkinella arboricola]